jgi:hypothetical protein
MLYNIHDRSATFCGYKWLTTSTCQSVDSGNHNKKTLERMKEEIPQSNKSTAGPLAQSRFVRRKNAERVKLKGSRSPGKAVYAHICTLSHCRIRMWKDKYRRQNTAHCASYAAQYLTDEFDVLPHAEQQTNIPFDARIV